LKLALIGFGTVGQGLAEILRDESDRLQREHGFAAQVVAVSDPHKGALYAPDGLDLARLLQVVDETGSMAAYPEASGLVRGWDSLKTIRESSADVVVEAAWTDLETGQPAIDHMRAAFNAGKHVVTTNKGPVALAYRELKDLADQKGLGWGIEGTVMSGTPALRLAQTSLAGAGITEVLGILNGTTNFILDRMEGGAAYEEALAEAQRLGYAEADPTADVEGFDALGKLLILSAVVMDTPLRAKEVQRQGISGLTPADIQQAAAEGKRWKLIAQLSREGDGVKASVAPQKLPLDHPLASVAGATNAITYSTQLLGDVTLVGAGAGRTETGYALLSDLLALPTEQSG
jgi:homoserine dehydrogenase